jgi:hypothetical protein
MTMQCDKAGDDALQGDKLELLYGEADSATRERVSAHLAGCAACREELGALEALRRDLGRWRLPRARPGFSPRGFVVPRWLAAATLLVLGFSAALSVSGYLSLRRSLQAQQARAERLEREQRAALGALQASLTGRPVTGDAAAILTRVDARLEEAAAEQLARLDRRFAEWQERAEVRRRADMAQVAAGLSYLDGRHGEQLARTNELVGYVLQASQRR